MLCLYVFLTSVACNYIRMKCKFDAIYQYAVSFAPQVDSKSMRFQLMNVHREVIGQVKAFDGSILFLPRRLEETTTILRSNRPTDNSEVVIRVGLTKILRPEECLQPYNVIFRKIMRILDMKQVSRHYYDPHKAVSVPQHKLEIWPGYITSLREYEGGLLLLTDVSHKVLRHENVLDFMYSLYRKSNSFQEDCTRQLVGNIVLTRYNNKTYRIDDIAWDKNPLSKFNYGHQGEEMTFVDYYMKAYNKEIQDLEQPLLISRPKRRNQDGEAEVICLIPELSNLTGLTDEMRQDFRVMKDIASHTRISPTERVRSMRKFMENIESSPEATNELAKWGLELDMDILKTEARTLPQEKIIFQNKTITASPEADWGREATRESVITPVHLQCWMVVFTKRDLNRAMDYIQMMKKVAPPMGIRVNNPLQLELRDDRTETYLRTIRESLNEQIQMVVIIFPTSRDDRYNAIKKLCCIESPVPSQVIISRTISQQQKLRSVTQKVALQINCKLGGELWALEIPLKQLMVVGIDVYHDATHGSRSVGAMVASTNNSLTRWFSRVCLQLPQQELMDGLKLCLTAALRKYHEVNHTLPDRIIVFRDGVGEGQLTFVSNYEVTQLKECFGHFGETYDPKLAVVVVQKRINTRIFAEYNGQFDNPRPGLVMDHTVTMNNWYDYFLVSQHVRQGTVSPTHYIVVYDGSNLKPDHMQRLSYKLTHLYYNWPGTVRVPAPCQYAHKLAYLVGQNIHKEPSHELSDRLFFL
ncbi:piwi-like protein 2 [Glandiceps talaboti]